MCHYRPGYTQREMAAGWLVVRSRIWLQTLRRAPPVIVMVQGHYDTLMKRASDWVDEYTIVSFDECVAEGQLGFEEKCLRTLENIDQSGV